jgi:hypothetical protein
MFSKKVPKNVMIIQFFVFLWIVLCNLLIQSFLHPLEEIGYINWSFFLANILFFIIEDPSYKDRFLKVLFGSLVGLLSAYFLAIIYTILEKTGMNPIVSIMIPLTIVLFLIINLHPIYPIVFYNIGFAYFTIALINAAAAYSKITDYILSAVAGNLIVNGIAVLIIIGLTKYFAKTPTIKNEKKYPKGKMAH